MNWINSNNCYLYVFFSNYGKEEKKGMVSYCEYYYYKLQIRLWCDSMILCVGWLLQPQVVDMYVKLETFKLDYLR